MSSRGADPSGPEVELVRGGVPDAAEWQAVLMAVRAAGVTTAPPSAGRPVPAAWAIAGRLEAAGRVPVRSRRDLVMLEGGRRTGE